MLSSSRKRAGLIVFELVIPDTTVPSKRKNSGHNRGAVEVITTIDLLKMLLLEVMFMMKRKETPSEDTPIG